MAPERANSRKNWSTRAARAGGGALDVVGHFDHHEVDLAGVGDHVEPLDGIALVDLGTGGDVGIDTVGRFLDVDRGLGELVTEVVAGILGGDLVVVGEAGGEGREIQFLNTSRTEKYSFT